MALKKGTEIATIDVNLVTLTTVGETPIEIAINTSSEVNIEPQIETEEGKKLIIKGLLKAQKTAIETLTGHSITLTDNVFTPELVQILQGGEIGYDAVDSTKIISYTPPLTGSGVRGVAFILSAYTAQYNAAGEIVQYEKITYPNCHGVPIKLSIKDGEFRVSEYTINSTPDTGVAPYTITYVETLPVAV